MGKIQKQDVKTSAELSAAGATDADLINDTQIYVSATGLNKTLSAAIIAGDLSGGGGGGGTGSTYTLSGILSEILSDEADTFVPSANQLVDDFGDEDKGTKTNVAQSSSALRFSGSNLSGSYERVKMVTKTMGSVDGGAVVSAQALAPKNTALSPSSTSTSVTFKFSGDVTNMFANTKKVIIVRKVISGDTGYDGKVGYVGVINSSGNIAELAVSGAPSYSGGADETTVVISNPDALDLDYDLSSSDYNTKLRVIPWDYTYQVKSATASSYETMPISDLSALDTVAIPGENFFSELFSITGSIRHHAGAISTNRQYAIVQLMEYTGASNMVAHFGYSTNYGQSWTKFSTTKTGMPTSSEEDSGQHYDSSKLGVADNGKAIWFYTTSNGSGFYAQSAVYSDLTAGTPALTDTPATGNDGRNNDGATAGKVANQTGDSSHIVAMDYDKTDLSYIAVLIYDLSAADWSPRWYSNGGATHVGVSSTGYGHTLSSSLPAVYVTGSGSTHRTLAIRYNANPDLIMHYWDQTAPTTEIGSGITLTTANDRIVATENSGTTGYILGCRSDSSESNELIKFSMSGTPAATYVSPLFNNTSGLVQDLYNGWNSSSAQNFYKNGNKRIAINPSSATHIALTTDLVHPDGIRRSTLIEIPDTTSVNFAGISQFSTNGATGINSATNFQQGGQSFTATASTPKLRTFSFLATQIGTIGSGYTMQADLYATSGGLPTGSSLGTSQTIDPSLISKNASGQWLHFNFNNITLTNTTVYAVVLSVTYPLSASNYIDIKTQGTSPYAGGAELRYNGSTWSAVSNDCTFMISDAYVTTIGKAIESGANRANYGFHDQESQIANINSTTAQVTFRRVSTSSDSQKQLGGHPYRRVLTWGSGGTQSTLTSAVVAGYSASNHDQNLVFATAVGYDDNKRQNVSTGVLDADKPLEDRSGMNMVGGTYTNISTADVISDASFQAGFALDLDGSTEHVTFADRPEFDLYFNKPFCMEFEMKPSSLAATSDIFGQYDSAASYGWYWLFRTDGSVLFQVANSSGTVIAQADAVASTISANTYYVFRIVYDGSGGAVRMYKATTYNGTFTEVSYSGSQTSFASGNTSSSAAFGIGRTQGFTRFFPGKLGYVKIANGSSTFAYSGYKGQAPLVGHINLGTRILAENKVGENSATSGTNFDNAGIISGDVAQASMVDSNNILVKFGDYSISGTKGKMMYFKWSGNRVSTRDVSALEAVNIRFKA